MNGVIITFLVLLHFAITILTLKVYFEIQTKYREFSPFSRPSIAHIAWMLTPLINLIYLIEGLEARFIGKFLKN